MPGWRKTRTIMTHVDRWPIWQRAVLTNVVTAIGIYIGFASSDVKLSVDLRVRLAVFTFAFMNLMLLVVRPRVLAQHFAGAGAQNPWGAFYEVVCGRPFITVLCVFQLVGVARATSTTIKLIQASVSDYVQALPSAETATLHLIGASALMATVAALWLLAALGIWRGDSWAWWLALALNGLAAAVTIALQLMKRDEFLLDPLAIAAVALLLYRPVRIQFKPVQVGEDRTAQSGGAV
jgi:hypothetical protein